MRIRSAWALPAMIVAGLSLVIPLGAQAVGAPGAAPSTGKVSSLITLPTGDRVHVRTAGGTSVSLIEPAATSGPGRVLTSRQLGSELYVLPAVAEPYLGRFLDPALFDVTSLAAHASAGGRLPVRLAYTGATPSVPGVTITSASAGSAAGYLTASSATAFGSALSAQWLSDAQAGFPARTSLFGVTKISADLPVTGTVTPDFPMYTLTVKAIAASGKPLRSGFAIVMNVDDARKYIGFAFIVDGEARLSVPAGTYAAIGDDFSFNSSTGAATVRATTVNEYTVTGAGQTLTIDHRRATASPSVSTPRPTNLASYTLSWGRGDAAGNGGLSAGYGIVGGDKFKISPSGPAKVGTLSVDQNWSLTQPGANPAYSYDLAAADDRVPADLSETFTPSDLAAVDSTYYADKANRKSQFIRFPVLAGSLGGFGFFNPITTPTQRTEYAGAKGAAATWIDTLLFNDRSFDDPGFFDGPQRALPAGSIRSQEWLHGPIGAGIPTQTGFPYCFACRTAGTLDFAMLGSTDSDPTHFGETFASSDGVPVTRYRFYRNGTLVKDENDYLGDEFSVGSGNATYKVVLDVDRRLTQTVQSTMSSTEVTFDSAAGQGPKAPSDWFCSAGSGCRVLPILQAKLSLPTTLDGRLPVGKSTVTVTAAQIQGAAKSAITSAGLRIRANGSSSWLTIPLSSVGGGSYRGVIDSLALAGSAVDVEVSAADAAGSTYKQTVSKAYTAAAS